METQQRIEKELGCKFMRINPSRENFDIIDEFGRIKNHIRKSTKKNRIREIFSELLNLEFKSGNSMKTKLLKWVVKRLLPKFNN